MTEHDLEMVRVRLAGLGRTWTPRDVADALRALGLVVSDAMVLYAVEALRRGSIGAGRLQPLLSIEGLTDVLVNGPDQVFIDRGHGLEDTQVRFESDAEVRQLATRLAASVGRRLDDACPFVDARLADGTRWTHGWPTAPACTPCSQPSPIREPACHCVFRRAAHSPWTTGWPTVRSAPKWPRCCGRWWRPRSHF